MKRRLVLLSICLLLLLSGCQKVKETAGNVVKKVYEIKKKPEAEALALLQNTPAEFNGLSVPSSKYTEVLAYQLTGIQGAALYQLKENETQESVYSVLRYATSSGALAEVAFYGPVNLAAQCGLSDGAVVLGTEDDACRLYVQKLSYTEDTEADMENSTILSWVSDENYNLAYTGGLYEKEQTDKGWRITYEVENTQWHGYTMVFCDNIAKQAYQVTYVEHTSVHDDVRAKNIVESVFVPDRTVEQTVTELTVERKHMNVLSTYPADYFAGSDYALARIGLSEIQEESAGSGKMLYAYDGMEYVVNLTIVDTIAPEITYSENAPEAIYFMPGAKVSVSEVAEQFFTATDESGEVFVTCPDGTEQLQLSEREFEAGVPKKLTVSVKDRFGNRAEAEVSVGIVATERIPEWYDAFFNGKWDTETVEALNQLICNPKCNPEDYLQQLYEEKKIELLLTEEMMTEALRGVERLEELDIKFTLQHRYADVSRIVLFYANVANIPEELLLIYVKNQEITLGYGDAWPIDQFDAFVITADMEETISNGMKKAEAQGISIPLEEVDILTASQYYVALERCTEAELAFYLVYEPFVKYGASSSTVKNSVEFLLQLTQMPEAGKGYERLKSKGIDVTLLSKENSSDILTWFTYAANYPEGIMQIYAEQDWDVIVPEDNLHWQVMNSAAIVQPEILAAAEKGLSAVAESGLQVEYPEQLTFFRLVDYYSDMSLVPAGLFDICVKEKMVWSIESYVLKDLTNKSKEKQMTLAITALENLEKSGIKLEYPKKMTAPFILACSKIAEYPDYYLQYCIQKGITLTESDWKELENWEYYIFWNNDCEAGFEKAKELGIDFIVEVKTEIWRPSICFEHLAEMPEEFLQLCQTLGTEFNVARPGAYLLWDKNFEKAMLGYEYLRDKNITIKHSGSNVSEVHDFFCEVETVPEEFFGFLAEAELPLELNNINSTIAEIKKDNYLLEEAYASVQQMKKLKLDIDYDKNVTVTEVIAFYRIMDDIPEEILKQYVSKGWEIEVECMDGWNHGFNYQAQDSITQELYDRALSGYKKVKKYGLKWKVTGDWDPIQMVSVYAGLDMVDTEVLDLYEEQDWVFILSDKTPEELYEGGASGLTSYGPKTIEIISTSRVDFLDDVIRHELGHYVDCAYGKGDAWCSDSKEFGKLFDKYKKAENGGTNDRGRVKDVLHDLKKVIYREYAFTNQYEFFAESYEMYLAYPEEFKANYPDVYKYIDKLFD